MGSSLNGSLTFRLKYGYAQLNLDDWMTQGIVGAARYSADALVDYEESIYRYRFQGTIFTEREGYPELRRTPALSFHYSLPAELRRRPRRASTTARATRSRKPTTRRRFRSAARFRPLPGARTLCAAFGSPASTTRDNYMQGRRAHARHRRGHLRAQVHERRRIDYIDATRPDIRHQRKWTARAVRSG